MAKFVCNCGEVLLTLPGGLGVDIDPEVSMADLVCASCGETGWSFADGMRFVDAGKTYAHVGEFASTTDNGKANMVECTCGSCNVVMNDTIEVDFMVRPELTEETIIPCCSCGDPLMVIPAGYRVLIVSGGKTITKFPRPEPGHPDWTFEMGL